MWKITDRQRLTFQQNKTSNDLYFPLTNSQGNIFSSISPILCGDIKTDQHSFLTPPVSITDLNNAFLSRNLWLYFSKERIINLSDSINKNPSTTIQAGPLWYKTSCQVKSEKIQIDTLNFVPENETAEVMIFSITNNSSATKSFIPFLGIPLFCRSADNLRDHRHVTSLLIRNKLVKYGMIITPTMCFDERGHHKNEKKYFAYSYINSSSAPEGFFPDFESFIGNSTLNSPQAVLKCLKPLKYTQKPIQGREPFAGIKFKKQILAPKKTLSITLILGIDDKKPDYFLPKKKIVSMFDKSNTTWKTYLERFDLETGEPNFDFWIRWVNLQPTLRKLLGCSFLPHFDYGKGGRGWRDLWQDLLALLLIDPEKTKPIILNNFKGIRIDGSNATIITSDKKFISDRNNISRVWSDHGIWPYLTLKLYIDQTKDLNILFNKTSYFKDHLLKRSREINRNWDGNYVLLNKNNKAYTGTILEHLLLQNLVQFFNVGKYNNIRLENADWNDGLDMAYENGETVTFSCMYYQNIKDLSLLLKEVKRTLKINHIDILQEASILFDSLHRPINYQNPKNKINLLNRYLENTKNGISGKTMKLSIDKVILDLERKANWGIKHINSKEWLKTPGIFNGYYDNLSKKAEGKIKNTTQMTLTGQVFPIMSKIADNPKIKSILKNSNKYLKHKNNTYRLNTDYKNNPPKLGRAFGFSYGDKENGSVFSHMNVMFSYSLYSQGFAREGFDILHGLYKNTIDNYQSYPQLPEYFNLQGKGLYSYLTGSASWYIYTIITQSFGIKGDLGNIILEPKLVKKQFGKNRSIKIKLPLNKKNIVLEYINKNKKDWPKYNIISAEINGKLFKDIGTKKLIIPQNQIDKILNKKINTLKIILD